MFATRRPWAGTLRIIFTEHAAMRKNVQLPGKKIAIQVRIHIKIKKTVHKNRPKQEKIQFLDLCLTMQGMVTWRRGRTADKCHRIRQKQLTSCKYLDWRRCTKFSLCTASPQGLLVLSWSPRRMIYGGIWNFLLCIQIYWRLCQLLLVFASTWDST